jgi:aminoglycoside phosphotransferase
MNSKEEILGGTLNHVVKINGLVQRQVKGHPMLHQYLIYLEKAGMAGVPRFLGIDEKGREILTYVPGDTAESGLDFDHPFLHSDHAICDMAKFLRRLHDISAGFLPTAINSGWTNPQLPGGHYETICHGDAAIWNFALTGGQITGMFDFDQACPGTRAWDLTITLFSAVLPSCYDYEPTEHADDTRRRIKLFFSAYGMECPGDIIARTADRIQIWCDEGEARGEPSVH